jgi:hypothetical protein
MSISVSAVRVIPICVAGLVFLFSLAPMEFRGRLAKLLERRGQVVGVRVAAATGMTKGLSVSIARRLLLIVGVFGIAFAVAIPMIGFAAMN